MSTQINIVSLPNTPSTMASAVYSIYNPLDIGDCSLWLDAADPSSMTFSGCNVTQWRDKSGTGLDLSQIPGSNTPTYVRNAIQFRSVLSFDGTQGLSRPLVSGAELAGSNTNEYSAFVVCSFTNNSNSAMPYSWNYYPLTNIVRILFMWLTFPGSPPNSGFMFAYGVNFNYPERVDMSPQIFTPTDRTYYLYSFTINNNVGNMYVKGGVNSVEYTNLISSNFGTIRQKLAVGIFEEQPLYNMKGNTAEILFYKKALSDTERQKVEAYLSWKWSIQPDLYTFNPYKTIPTNNMVLYPVPVMTTASWLPLKIAGLQLWLDATDPLGNGTQTLYNQVITNWKDKSPNGANATAIDGAVVFKKSANGRDSLFFNGTSTGYRYLTVTINSANHTFFIVSKPTTVTSDSGYNFIITFQNSGGGSPYIVYPHYTTAYGGAKGYITSYDGTPLNNENSTLVDNAVANQVNLSCAVIRSGLQQVYKSGTLQSSTTQSLSSSTTPSLYLGTSPLGALDLFSGELCEVIIYNTPLTQTQRQQTEGYLAWKWGIQSSLPANHPYAKWPPSP